MRTSPAVGSAEHVEETLSTFAIRRSLQVAALRIHMGLEERTTTGLTCHSLDEFSAQLPNPQSVDESGGRSATQNSLSETKEARMLPSQTAISSVTPVSFRQQHPEQTRRERSPLVVLSTQQHKGAPNEGGHRELAMQIICEPSNTFDTNHPRNAASRLIAS